MTGAYSVPVMSVMCAPWIWNLNPATPWPLLRRGHAPA
jgi:hypothetical protein